MCSFLAEQEPFGEKFADLKRNQRDNKQQRYRHHCLHLVLEHASHSSNEFIHLSDELENLTSEVENLTSEVENLTREVENLTREVENLTREVENLTRGLRI